MICSEEVQHRVCVHERSKTPGLGAYDEKVELCAEALLT